MIDHKKVRAKLHDLAFTYGVRQPKLRYVNLSKRFYNYFGFSMKDTCIRTSAFYDYKTKTILLDPQRANIKDVEHEFRHYLQHQRKPKEFIQWDKTMRKLAKKSFKTWLRAYYSSKFEKSARRQS